jgi:hypothetical protein
VRASELARPALRPWALLGSAIGVGFVLLARRALPTGVTHALRTA